MIKTETREFVKAEVTASPEGISLSELHQQVHRKLTRLQLRTLLDSLYTKGEISRERIKEKNRKETRYYPFNGKACEKRARKMKKETESGMLSMKDFMPGKKYRAYLDF